MPKYSFSLSALLCGALLPLTALAQDASPPRDWTYLGLMTRSAPAGTGAKTTLGKKDGSFQAESLVEHTAFHSGHRHRAVNRHRAGSGKAFAAARPQATWRSCLALTYDLVGSRSTPTRGKILWQKTYANSIKPQIPADWLCPNTANDTPVIDKARGIIYFIASDGKPCGL